MKIKQLADTVGFDRITIRRWEKEGLFPPVNRSANGQRNYSTEDLINILNVIREKREKK